MNEPSSGRLRGKGCLIVGGTGGIGRATAIRFLDEGARVVVSGHDESAGPGASPLSDTVLEGLGLSGVLGFSCDVVSPAAVQQLFDAALERLGGRLDALVHVAGISGRRFGDGPLHECTDEGWSRVLEVNAAGVFHTNRAAVRVMRDQEMDASGVRGAIVNVGSVLDRSPSPVLFDTIAYAASKGAVRSLTLAAAARYAPERIRFNLVVPGLIETPMSSRAVNDPRITAYLAGKQPMAGGPGRPEDVAEAALFLCEPATRFLTGIELLVDGGWSIAEGQHPIGNSS